MKKMIALGLLVLAPLSAPAAAAPNADQAGAMKGLETVVRMSPSDGGAYIELAAAYLRDGRHADAMAAYRHALALDNVMMETRLGDAIWSHEIAQKALAREVTLTAR